MITLTQELLQQFGWDILVHPTHSADSAPNDYHLFTKLKENLVGIDLKMTRIFKSSSRLVCRSWRETIMRPVYKIHSMVPLVHRT